MTQDRSRRGFVETSQSAGTNRPGAHSRGVSPRQAGPPQVVLWAREPAEEGCPCGVLPALVVSGAMRRPDGLHPDRVVVADWGRLYGPSVAIILLQSLASRLPGGGAGGPAAALIAKGATGASTRRAESLSSVTVTVAAARPVGDAGQQPVRRGDRPVVAGAVAVP